MAYQLISNYSSNSNATNYGQVYYVTWSHMDQYHTRKACFTLKITDGLFLGKGQSLYLTEFLDNNKVRLVVNCSSVQTPTPKHLTMKVLCFPWTNVDQETILAPSVMDKFQLVYASIQETRSSCESALICSLQGQSRSLTVITAYLMRKYSWSLYKTLQYLNSRRQDFQIRSGFLKQLMWFQSYLFGKKHKNCTRNWDGQQATYEGKVLRNTYLNSSTVEHHLSSELDKAEKKPSRNRIVSFADHSGQVEGSLQRRQSNSGVLGEKVEVQLGSQKDQVRDLDLDDLDEPALPRSVPKRARKVYLESPPQRIQHRKQSPYQVSYTPFGKNDRSSIPTKTEPSQDIKISINLNIKSLNIFSNQLHNIGSYIIRKSGTSLKARRKYSSFLCASPKRPPIKNLSSSSAPKKSPSPKKFNQPNLIIGPDNKLARRVRTPIIAIKK